MYRNHCSCRTEALRVFIRSLTAPSTPQWRQPARLPGLDWGTRLSSKSSMRHTLMGSASLSARSLHTTSLLQHAQATANAAVREVDLDLEATSFAATSSNATPNETSHEEMIAANAHTTDAPDASFDPQTKVTDSAEQRITTEETEKVEALSSQLGKNARKRLRKKQEEEALKAAENPPKIKKNARKRLERLVLEEAQRSGGEIPEAAGAASEAAAEESVQATKKPKSAKARKKRSHDSPEPAVASSATKTSTNNSPPSSPPEDAPNRRLRKLLNERLEPWQVQKQALKEKFPEGWQPRKKLSPDALEGIRALHQQMPQTYTTAVLAEHFQVSPEAIRRVLKAKWKATPEEEERRAVRWQERGRQVWARWAELGRKPPRKWREEGIHRDPLYAFRRRQLRETREALEGMQLQGEDGGASVAASAATGVAGRAPYMDAEPNPHKGRNSKGRRLRLQRKLSHTLM